MDKASSFAGADLLTCIIAAFVIGGAIFMLTPAPVVVMVHIIKDQREEQEDEDLEKLLKFYRQGRQEAEAEVVAKRKLNKSQ